MADGGFTWDAAKAAANVLKHGLAFDEAVAAFMDPRRLIAVDEKHSQREPRWFCIGRIADGSIATVRFTRRGEAIRLLGSGRWRKGRKLYEEEGGVSQ